MDAINTVNKIALKLIYEGEILKRNDECLFKYSLFTLWLLCLILTSVWLVYISNYSS